jgi:hypothetical protein
VCECAADGIRPAIAGGLTWGFAGRTVLLVDIVGGLGTDTAVVLRPLVVLVGIGICCNLSRGPFRRNMQVYYYKTDYLSRNFGKLYENSDRLNDRQ